MIDFRAGFKHCDVLDIDQVKQVIDICMHNILYLFSIFESY